MDFTALFPYDPIQPDQIRLFRFVQDSDYLSATLETFSANDSCPQYNALSYTWSTYNSGATKSWAIRIGEHDLPVLDSLEPFVQALRSRRALLDGTWWWIDSICIDQTNIQERDEHVRRMQDIYQNARDVIVWLGEQSLDSDCAIDFIHLLDAMNRAGISTSELRTIFPEFRYFLEWGALQRIFSRKWWTRVWTVQESVVPSSISFWCGPRQISRDAMFTALYAADRCDVSRLKDSMAFLNSWNRSRAWFLHKSEEEFSLSLLALAAFFCGNEATDDRDRLYGLNALATENHGLQVDYSKTVDEVYLHFAQSFIERHQSLDIICFASCFPSICHFSLPSWVPDWRARPKPYVIRLMASQSATGFVGNLRPVRAMPHHEKMVHYSASGSTAAMYNFDGPALLARGVIIDVVDGLAASAASRRIRCVQTSWKHAQTPSTEISPIEILTRMCRCLVLNREDRYLRFPVPIEQFSRDFIRMCLDFISGSGKEVWNHNAFAIWFYDSQQLLIHGEALGQIVRNLQNDGTDAFVASAPSLDPYIHDTFYGRFTDTSGPMSLRFMTSKEGRIGMVSQRAMKGDLICVLFGCSIPVILRRTERQDEFRVVGECFLDECMEGQALEQCKSLEREFRIT
jgi:hypothetical protein